MAKKQPPKKIGRPPKFNDAITEEICSRIAGGESLRNICKSEHLPSIATVRTWLFKADSGDAEYAPFLSQYARAREEQADHYADEIIEISDYTAADVIIDAEGVPRLNIDAIQRAKLRVDSRKWVASKLKPKRYGDKTTIGGDPDNPIQANIVTKIIVEHVTPHKK